MSQGNSNFQHLVTLSSDCYSAEVDPIQWSPVNPPGDECTYSSSASDRVLVNRTYSCAVDEDPAMAFSAPPDKQPARDSICNSELDDSKTDDSRIADSKIADSKIDDSDIDSSASHGCCDDSRESANSRFSEAESPSPADEAFALLSAYLDDEVTEAERCLVEHWLLSDPEMNSHYQKQLRLKAAIKSLWKEGL